MLKKTFKYYKTAGKKSSDGNYTPIMITGKKITLKPFEAEDSERFRNWINSLNVLEFAQFRLPVSELEHLQWYEKIANDKSRVFFACYNNGDMSHKACVWLENIDIYNGNAEIFAVDGDETSTLNEYVTESVQLLLKYAFESLKLNKLYSNVPLSKASFKNMLEKAGFESEALLREEVFINGKYEDITRMVAFKNPPKTVTEQNDKKDTAPVPEVQWFHSAKSTRKF